MPPKENPERACEECIHFFACSRQCGEPMAQRSATGCECYETIKSSMAYYVGALDGAKGKIPNRLRELAEADKEGRVVVLPCKVGETVYFARANPILQYKVTGYEMGEASISQVRSKHVDKETGLTFNFTFRPGSIGKTVFLSREEAEKALEEREGKKDGNETNM